MQHRDDRDADVHLGILDANLDAPILRQALLGDVEVAENLHARHDGRLEPLDLGRHRHVLQHAVNAVADAEFVLERLEVDVRGAQLDGVAQHLVDEADDGGVLGCGVQVGVLLAMVLHDLKGAVLAQGAQSIRAHAQALLHLALDGFAGRQHRLEGQAGHGLERIQALGGEEPAGGHFDGAVDAAQRQQLFLEEEAGGEQREELAVRLDVLEGGVGQAILLGQPAQHIGFPLQRVLGLGCAGAQQHLRVGRGELLGGDHLVEQRL